MKQISNSIKTTAILMLVVILTGSSAFAAAFTAVASGSWSSTTTWGGTAPANTITSDQIIIPAGITVSLGNNVSINGATASLAVLGSLTDNATDTLALTAGAITGTGSIAVNSLALNATSTLAFTGTIAVQTLSNSSAGLALTANTTVNQTLYLAGGTLSIEAAGVLNLASNSTIVVAGGQVVNDGGTLSLTGSYNVDYISSSSTTGTEITGAGMHNLTINVSSGNNVSLSSDLTVSGTLALTSGSLVLNGHNLTLTGDIAAGGSGTISSTSTSNISVNTSASPSGSLALSSGSNSVNNLNIEITTASGMLTLGSDIIVNGSLNFTGGSVNTGTNGLHLGTSATVTGADSSSYIVATGGGYVAAQMTAGNSTWTTFPVGSSIHYSPIAAQLNSGSASGSVSASVSDDVYAGGTAGNGANLTSTQASVAMTYYVEPDSNTSSNLNLRLTWSASMEVNAFNRDSAYISHYTNSAWDASAVGSATAQGSLYFMERDNITSFSPFAVFGKQANTVNSIVTISAGDFDIYPNPASDHLVIKNISGGDSYNMTITDMTGQIVGTYAITGANNTVSVAGLTDGNYIIRLSNSQMSVVKKFVKM
jgi:hypothetical protein